MKHLFYATTFTSKGNTKITTEKRLCDCTFKVLNLNLLYVETSAKASITEEAYVQN